MLNKVKKQRGVGALFELKQDGIPLFTFGYDRENLARILAESVRKEEYVLSPPVLCAIKVKNKERLIYKFSPLDKIVIGTIGTFLTEVLAPFIHDEVFSYRKHLSASDEVKSLSKYIMSQRKRNNRSQFYLFQTDIHSYSDEINVQDHSPFWETLNSIFKQANLKPSKYHWQLIKDTIRPSYINDEGSLACNLKGLPTGSPIAPFVYNFYVYTVDTALSRPEELFYARYGDDIVICHHDIQIMSGYVTKLSTNLQKLKLQKSPKKTHLFYLSPAGNSCPYGQWRGVNRVDILGFNLNAQGHYCVSMPRQKSLLKKIRLRIQNILHTLADEDQETKGRLLCQILSKFMIDESHISSPIISAVENSNDTKQLKHLDYLIALSIAESLSGIRGCRSFRKIPYKTIRRKWGLLSLARMKSHGY